MSNSKEALQKVPEIEPTPPDDFLFLGRQEEQERFSQLTYRLKREGLANRFFNLHGLPGMGKTALLERFQETCQIRSIPCVAVNLDRVQQVEDLWQPLAGGLTHSLFSLHSPTFADHLGAVTAQLAIGRPEQAYQILREVVRSPTVIFFDQVDDCPPEVKNRVLGTIVEPLVRQNNNKCLVIWASRQEEGLAAHFSIRMRAAPLPLVHFTLEEVKNASLPESLGELIYQATGGYPPAVSYYVNLAISGDLDAFTGWKRPPSTWVDRAHEMICHDWQLTKDELRHLTTIALIGEINYNLFKRPEIKHLFISGEKDWLRFSSPSRRALIFSGSALGQRVVPPLETILRQYANIHHRERVEEIQEAVALAQKRLRAEQDQLAELSSKLTRK